MQFKVPQFLDIEDKIFGPFTFSEFVYLAGGGGICYVLYKALGLLIGFIPMLIVAGFALALTFYRPNDKPFIKMLEAGFKYVIQDKLYIWKKDWTKNKKLNSSNISSKEKKIEFEKSQKKNARASRLSGSKLRDLAWSLDVLDLKK
jgi:hypothetical protein